MTTEQADLVQSQSVQNDPAVAAAWDRLLNSPPLPKILQSIDAFRRDLPELLEKHARRWVAYSGDERICFGRTQTRVCQECFRRGLTLDDFIAAYVEPGAFDPDEEIELTCDDV
jgi:hypothetical protein